MSRRMRPAGCRVTPQRPDDLPHTERDRLVRVFKALADPTRLEVFRLIAAQAEAICARDVVSRFDVSQPTIAHHLRVLREAGLITTSRRGVWAYYAVDEDGIGWLSHRFDGLVPAHLAATG